jgi:hypothetical protein
MTYVDLDLEDDLYQELQTLADEEGISVEDLIVDILRDEFALPSGDDGLVEDTLDDEDDEDDPDGLDYEDDDQ